MPADDENPHVERAIPDSVTGEPNENLPLRERFPGYVKSFVRGLGITGLVGLGFSAITDLSPATAVGQTWMLFGVYWLMVGGLSGGGYTNLSVGAVEALVRRRRQVADPAAAHYIDLTQGSGTQDDPKERLRKGLRPPPNPKAFWQVVGGFLYIAAGLPITI